MATTDAAKRVWARLNLDTFLLLLVGTVTLATVLPARGPMQGVVDVVANAAIMLLFFLHGAKLSREAVVAGAGNWRLHGLVAAFTFGVFPLLGLAVTLIPGLSPLVATGFLFLTLLPSTVQSSIAFTAIARGNVAAAVCSATFSNLAGMVLTPLLVATLMHASGGGFSWGAVKSIVLQLLVPFLAGHGLRPWLGPWVARHKPLTTTVDRGSILLVVYSAFGAAVVKGIWHQVSGLDLAVIGLISAVILGLVLTLSEALARAAGMPVADRIVVQFCGSKKSLASGVPMAGVLFPPAQVGAVILPLMLFHQIQLMACAALARRYGARDED